MNNPTGVPLVSKTSSTTKTAWGKDAKGFYQAKLNPATNQMIPATKNYDVLPPAAYMEHIKQGYYYYTDEQGALHQVPVTTTTSVGGASGGGRSRTTVPEPPSASLGASSAPAAPVAAVVSQAASQGDHILGHKGPTGQTKSRADAAAAIVPLISHVRQMLGDIPPEEYAAASDAYKKAVEDTKDYEGPASGRIALMEKRIGNLPRKARELAGTLISIYSLAGTMHGWRALKVAEEFEKTYGGLEASPDSLLGGMDAMANTAHEIYKAGYHHDIGEAPGGGGSSVIYARDPQGKLHKASAGTAIPKGWKVENAPTVH